MDESERKEIRAVFRNKGVSDSEYGKKISLFFTDLYLEGEFLTDLYSFGDLKCFKKADLKSGDIVSFYALVDRSPISLNIKRPTNVEKIVFESYEEGFRYCLNKFLKPDKSLTKEEVSKELVAFSKMIIGVGNDMDFWRYLALPFRLNSLYWFSTQDGKTAIQENFKKFNQSVMSISIEREKFDIAENKLGEKIIFDKKNQTLMDFLS